MVQNALPPEDDELPSSEEGVEKVESAPPPRSLKIPVFVTRILVRLAQFETRLRAFITSREPRLVPTITTLVGVTILLALGTWQIARLDQKNTALAQIKAQLNAPPEDLRRVIPKDDTAWRALNYRPVIVSGTWLTVHQFKMIPRTFEGQVGYHLVLPLKLPDGRVVLVNRGFVPDNARILPPDDESVVAVQGVLHIPETRKSWATPENIPSQRVWTWTDLAAMRHEIGVNSIAPVVLYEARHEARDSYPIGGQLPVPTHNRHRQYALVWYALALAFMVIWMIASKPKEKLAAAEEIAANDDERLNDPVARRSMYPEATD